MTAAALLWGLAIWGAPGTVSRLRAIALLTISLGAGFVAGITWCIASGLRHLADIGAGAFAALRIPMAWLRRPSVGRPTGMLVTVRRGARWVNAGAWAVLALDAAFLYLCLY